MMGRERARWWRALAAGAGAALAVSASAQDSGLERRLERVERLVNSQKLVEMYTRIESLQQEVQRLRGELEVQSHRLEEMRERQRELYVDVDRRLQRLEAVATAPAAPAQDGGTGAGAPASPADTPAEAGGPVPDAAQREAYDQSLAILKEGRYDAAAKAFERFLAAYPDSPYADNAQYWLAETHYVSRRFDQALAGFRKVLERFPRSPKVVDARLKIGYIHYEQQDWQAARKTLEQVVREHPDSTAARLAKSRLERMDKEGH